MFVTGGAGFVGRHLIAASEQQGWQIVAPPAASVDVRNRTRIVNEICEWRPTVVVHLAYRRDDRLTIVEGSRHVAEAAAAAGAHLVHLSSDAVFRGRPMSYQESDRPDPITDYGRWKAEAEDAVCAALPTATIVRTSLLYGTELFSAAQNEVKAACQGLTDITFFTEEVRCPVHATDVARAVSELASRRDFGGVINVAGAPMSRAHFAQHLAAWMGLDATMLRTGTAADSGMLRPGVVMLDSSLAASLGLRCGAIDEWMPLSPARR
jgi:dTDP-4-dehydrorhamnose reductase